MVGFKKLRILLIFEDGSSVVAWTWLERIVVTASGVRVCSFGPALFGSEISTMVWEAARLIESTVVVGVPALGPGAAVVVVPLSAVNKLMHLMKPTLYILILLELAYSRLVVPFEWL